MKTTNFILALLLLSAIILQPIEGESQVENYTFKLSQSNGSYQFWTTPPSERVFKNDAVPSDTDSEVKVYAAQNEFEPFQVVVKPTSSGNVTVSIADFGSGITVELYQVKYVNITQATDILGKTGDYPDPLWPIGNGDQVTLVANKNCSFWFSVYVPAGVASTDYSANVSIGGVNIPIRLHVFNFVIPDDLHVKSQMNFSHNTILSKYGVSGTGAEYWMYVDKIKQFFIDHRLTPKAALWSGGVTSNGAGPYIGYNCDTETLTDNDGIWGFEDPAERYLDGTGLMEGRFTQSFNGGTGFPSFMAATFLNNDSSADQRRSPFCELTRGAGDWYTADNLTTPYNQKWFSYIEDLQNYLNTTDHLDKAYYYFANEPQDQADYDAVAWYSRHLKGAAPNLKLMVSENPRTEIFNHSDYVSDGQIDIWLPVLNQYDPDISHDRELNHGEVSWVYFLHGTRPPYFNPITLDHPGIESKFTGWFLWKYRIKGIAYYSLTNWSQNPWTDPLNSDHNGDLFMLYPPSEDNQDIAYGSNNHRFVPSIRFELMRDSFEDYEYLYDLIGENQPQVGVANAADTQVDKVITGLASYTRDSEFMYNLRRFVGLKNGGEIAEIPDIQPPVVHQRSEGSPGDYYINFQDPYETFDSQPYGNPQMRDEVIGGISYRILDYDGQSYYAIGADGYDDDKGFGWFGNIIDQPVEGRDPYGDETDETKRTYVGDNYGKVNTFEFALPSGTYNVTLSVGRPRSDDAHNQATIEGVNFVNDEATNDAAQFIIRTNQLSVSDNSLTIEIGLNSMDEYTMLNYLNIEAIYTPAETDQPSVSTGTDVVVTGTNTGASVTFDNVGTAGTMNLNSYDMIPPSSAAQEFSGTPATSDDGSSITVIRVANKYWTIDGGTVGFSGTFSVTLPLAGISGISDPEKLVGVKRNNAASSWVPHNTTYNSGDNTITISGFTSFSDFGIGGDAENSLPVELKSFYAEIVADGIKLHWSTSSEVDNAGFYLYRNGERVSDLIPGQGTTSNSHSYSYLDKNIKANITYRYKISDVEKDTNSETHHPEIAVVFDERKIGQTQTVPLVYALHDNYPNPFNPNTTIKFDLPYSSQVSLLIYDVNGKLVRTLINNRKNAGYHSLEWNGTDDRGQMVTSGIYFYKITTENYSETKQMILLK